jgi:hypothetical protein
MDVQNTTMFGSLAPPGRCQVVRWPRSWAGAWRAALGVGNRLASAVGVSSIGSGGARRARRPSVEWLGKSRLTPASVEAARKHIGRHPTSLRGR